MTMAEPRRLARRGTRPILSPQRRRFTLEWLRSSSATEAAIKAGYSPKTATKQASRLLTSVDVQRFLAGRVAKLELEADAVMGEVARQAFEEIPNIVDLFDERNNLRPLHTLTLEQQRSIAGLDVVKRNLVAGDKKTDVVHKIRLWNIRAERTKAQELLAKLLKLVNNEPPGAPQVPMFAISCLPDLSPNPSLPQQLPIRDLPPADGT